jgi:2-polyprenyl-3-methyl-5-hydroxy-6-metoxy-1,4-benzoquinol methylase
MSSLAEVERAKYARAWADPRYRAQAHGLDLWRRERGIFPAEVRTALDVGCGHGRLMAAWLDEGIDAWGVDVVDGLDPEVRARYGHRLVVCPVWEFTSETTFDVAVCADFLEHLPREMVDPSLHRLADYCHVVVAQTAEFPSKFLDMTLHLTVEPASWWRARMLAAGGGTVEEFPHRGRRGRKHILVWKMSP